MKVNVRSPHFFFDLNDEFVIIENPLRLVPNALKDEPVLFVLKLINERIRIDQSLLNLKEKVMSGKISWSTWREKSDKMMRKCKEIERLFKEVKEKGEKLPEFALKFIEIGSIDTSDLVAFVKDEYHKERQSMILDGIKQLKLEEKRISDLLEGLNVRKEKGEISEKEYNQFKNECGPKLKKIQDFRREVLKTLH